MNERLGIVEERQAKRDAVLATARISNAARARIMGRIHYRPPAKEHRIVVDIKADTRTVETTDHVERMRARPARTRIIKGKQADILHAVVEAFNVTLHALLDVNSTQQASQARFAACLLMRERRKMSFPQIGKALRRDHTTAINGVRRAAGLQHTDSEWAARYHSAQLILDGVK